MASLPALPTATAQSPCLATGCSACCHDTEMLLTEADVERIDLVAGGRDWWFQAGDGYLQLRTRDGPAAKGAPSASARPCVFLRGDGHCSVWEDRPEGCRLYPAVWDGEALRAHKDDEHCPHTAGFALPQASADAVRRLAAKLERERSARSA
jgi:hypothetical protein